MKGYTVEVYKADRRTKAGEKLVKKIDFPDATAKQLVKEITRLPYKAKDGYRIEYHQTMEQVRNLMTGKLVWQRYDTPWYCSVASETYWCS